MQQSPRQHAEGGGGDPLEDLRARLRETSEAARRIADDRPPPRGWDAPREGGAGRSERPSVDVADLVLLAEQTGALLAEVARGVVPEELRRQFVDALHDLLVAVRALIDWYLERLGRERPDPPSEPEVEDIPIA